ncbi:hypothetical protein NL676_009289 [Syzygium grande]|nr:hypothetical protein NL676_009289 [Syzygium grande]
MGECLSFSNLYTLSAFLNTRDGIVGKTIFPNDQTPVREARVFCRSHQSPSSSPRCISFDLIELIEPGPDTAGSSPTCAGYFRGRGFDMEATL